MSKIVLASQSVQRQTLMATLGIPFEVVPANIDEKAIQDSDPKHRAQLIAQAKGLAISERYPQAIIIAADAFVVCQGKTLEKPESLVEAKAMLGLQAGQWITEYCGVFYADPDNSLVVATSMTTKAKFRELSSTEIEKYVSENPVLTWSGAFSPAYPAGSALIEAVEGSLTGFTYGFPFEVIVPLLQKSGVLK